ncbi:MAG: hypothetical protein LIO90_05760 [Bacteroidales bacterium]|nr:hypothetical protein [Bacteroidales bacterium]
MKIIALNHPIGTLPTMTPSLDVIADSALVMPGKPMFLPDFSPQWSGRLYVALRVSRLGKAISEKFASRYYDGVALALRLVPILTEKELQLAGGSKGLLGLFDYCVALGPWMPVETLGSKMTLTFQGENIPIDAEQLQLSKTISRISQYATIKMGDVVLPCSFPNEIAIVVNQVVDATITPQGASPIDALHVRIK